MTAQSNITGPRSNLFRSTEFFRIFIYDSKEALRADAADALNPLLT